MGGIGSTISKYGNEFYLFFGLGDEGYVGTVNSIKIEERVIESEVKKKKERNLELGWKEHNMLDDSDSEI